MNSMLTGSVRMRELIRTVGNLARSDSRPPAGHTPGHRPHGIELFWWRSPAGVNFGDYLSSVIVTKMAADADCFLGEERPTPIRLLAVGSILHFARDGDVIWGSGVNGKVPVERHTFSQLDIRAVRGPLTRDFLLQRGIEAPEIFGDPAILIAELLPSRFPRLAGQADPVAFVPNLHDLPAMEGWENVVSPLDPWWSVVRRISRARHVISTSLHGLVVADAFGVPCTYLRLSEEENLFKYEDYILGVGRSGLRVTRSREEAVRASPFDPIRFDTARLKASFPYDLWNR
ncbi:polysaccharide pyruvyl transferase family protein [Mesorhizobium koreense]|jgi:pyruvyltransferase|uniref:polysaccharide pyruvyl transferase family protein n=1 Tax=Mesorhizobium koreense TaxID=3074855 RepID=UPI00287BB961|nr:polysaccharide pyruvyl transferase family protein [Mesorhizobium sp. WR6]